MNGSKFSDAQKTFILKQGADGMPVADICRKAGISPATYFNWKKKYDGLLPTEMRRLKQLEDENAKLRKVVADLTRRCYRTPFAEKFEAWPEAQAGRCDARRMGCVDPADLPGVRGRHLDLSLQIPSLRSGPARGADQGDLPDADPLRLSADSCPATP